MQSSATIPADSYRNLIANPLLILEGCWRDALEKALEIKKHFRKEKKAKPPKIKPFYQCRRPESNQNKLLKTL